MGRRLNYVNYYCMKKILNIFFVTLGVIFFLLILSGVYFYITDPLNLKPLLFGNQATESTTTSADSPTTQTNESTPSRLTESQAKALETFGIDPEAIPTTITPEQEACFVEVLGSARVEEIKAGDAPTAVEYFTARGCLE